MIRPPTGTTRTDPLFPYTTLCRSGDGLPPSREHTAYAGKDDRALSGQSGDHFGPVGRIDRAVDFDLAVGQPRPGDLRPPRVRAPLPAADAPAPRSFGLDRQRRAEIGRAHV